MIDRLLVSHQFGPERGRRLRDRLTAALDDDVVVYAETQSAADELLPTADAVVCRSLPPAALAAAESLVWLQASTAGVDDFPLERLSDRGVRVTSATGVRTQPVAEQVLGYLLGFARNLYTHHRYQREGVWHRDRGTELGDATVGVVGLGAVGRRVAALCDAVGAEVVATKRDTSVEAPNVDDLRPANELESTLIDADYAVLSCPLTDQTEGLLGMAEFRLLGPDGVLVNVARGEVCRHDALVRALQSGELGGAALDVFPEEPLPATSPLWDLPNTVVTPHSAGLTDCATDRWAELVADNYRRLERGNALRNRVV